MRDGDDGLAVWSGTRESPRGAIFESVMRGIKSCLLPVLGWLALAGAPLAGAESGAPTPAGVKPVRGVQATFTALPSGASDVRSERLVALTVPAGTQPTALLPAGRFHVVFETSLTLPLRGVITFSFAGSGAAKLVVNGETVCEESGAVLGTKSSAAISLNQGANKLQVFYESPAAGDAAFRLYWAGKDFAREPVPPTALWRDPAASSLRAAERVRAGRALVTELHCLKCHAAGFPGAAAGEAAPSLEDAGARFRSDWLAAWIADPKKMRADTAMPRLALVSQDAADIAAWLSTQGRPAAAPLFGPGLTVAGAKLFTDLHCIACHALPGRPAQVGNLSRVSLAYAKAKWQPAALVAFLLNPGDYHSAIRMPQFRLSNDEARALTAFLLTQEGSIPPKSQGDPVRGQSLLAAAGCAQCHSGLTARGNVPVLAAAGSGHGSFPALSSRLDWSRGCMADTVAARGRAPDFSLDAEARESLRAFAATGMESLQNETPIEFAQRQYTVLRCAACHARDGREAAFASLDEEIKQLREELAIGEGGENGSEESLDQSPPDLTWAGEKLQADWLKHQIAGDLRSASRPWLKARMPGFGARAEGLAHGLALGHGEALRETPLPAADVVRVKLGETLVGPQAFNCVMCHAAGGQPASAPFGAPGINFALVPERLRLEHYHRWLDHPQRITPATKMPKFTDTHGRSLQTAFLEGDAHAQWDAIHAYLRQLAAAPK